MIGKWHLGSLAGEHPLDQGFERFFGHHKGCIDNWSHFFYWQGPNRHDLWSDREEHFEEGTHFGELVVREANAFVRANADRPFFLFLPLNTPHYPLQPTAKWRERFAGVASPRGEYLASLATMDEQVGAILAEIDALGLRNDTVVVFQSDHGHSTEIRTKGGGSSAGPYRGAKFSLFEGGLRVPAIVSWPGRLPQGEVRDPIARATDWFPTLLALCGVAPPAGLELDGRDLGPLLRDAAIPSPHETLHWQNGEQWSVRQDRWKLVARAQTAERKQLEGSDSLWLADLEADPGEAGNLAAAQPETVARLKALHDAWAASLGIALRAPREDETVSFEAADAETEAQRLAARTPVASGEAHAAHGELDLVFLGDSVVEDFGGPGRHLGQSAPQVWERFHGARRAANFGISGDRTQNLLWRIENGAFDGANPQVVVLMIGADNITDDPPEAIALGIEAVIDALRERLPHTTILLHGLLACGAAPADPNRQAAERVNEWIAPLGRRDGVIFLDLAPHFLRADGGADPALFRSDFLHLWPAGYRAWAQAIEPVLAARLTPR